MFELAANADLVRLTDQIDELSTRLILDGVATVGTADFEQLSHAAADLDIGTVADSAHHIAEDLASALELPLSERTRIASCGLAKLRQLLDDSSVARQSLSQSPDAIPSATINPLSADCDLVREFVTESSEHLATIEGQLLLLENDRSATEALNAIFRGFHTIKGLAGFLEFSEIQSLAHEVETLLDLARAAQLEVTPAVVDVVLEAADVVRQELASIEQRLKGATPPPSNIDASLMARIRRAARGQAPGAEPAPGPLASVGTPTCEQAPRVSPSSTPSPIANEASRGQEGPTSDPKRHDRRLGDSTSIRIDTAKLDQLMDMVGEMVIAQTLIGHSPSLAAVKDAGLQRNLSQLAHITSDVQRITTSMRMIPIGMQFNRTARVVRDLARHAGKRIEFHATGENTELDKTIAEELSDPLLHMVRNSVDHGIESHEERIAMGKDATAHIRVSAAHQSGQIVIAISDDGRGLDREKILAKALRNGLVQPGLQLPDNEIFLLIFEPGFSTAEKVTDISGRGVGMDVVRRHVQKLRGRIDIQSKSGEGATFSIKVPLTLAIIEGLVVMVGQQRYIVPLFAVREMFRPTRAMLSTVHGKGEMVMVRDSLMPIIRLHRRFSMEPRSVDFTEGILIAAESAGRPFCLFVDDLVGKQEVVIKSLGQQFRHVAGVAGCAILGDGRVGLILDIEGIYKGGA